jgi:hypothetical protein
VQPDMGVLPIFDKAAAWDEYDTTARALPGCEHNQAWWKEGPRRPPPPDCEHNRPWRAKLRTDWVTYLAALDNP